MSGRFHRAIESAGTAAESYRRIGSRRRKRNGPGTSYGEGSNTKSRKEILCSYDISESNGVLNSSWPGALLTRECVGDTRVHMCYASVINESSSIEPCWIFSQLLHIIVSARRELSLPNFAIHNVRRSVDTLAGQIDLHFVIPKVHELRKMLVMSTFGIIYIYILNIMILKSRDIYKRYENRLCIQVFESWGSSDFESFRFLVVRVFHNHRILILDFELLMFRVLGLKVESLHKNMSKPPCPLSSNHSFSLVSSITKHPIYIEPRMDDRQSCRFHSHPNKNFSSSLVPRCPISLFCSSSSFLFLSHIFLPLNEETSSGNRRVQRLTEQKTIDQTRL